MLLRVSMGWLMVIWGLDKIVNVDHAVRVADHFYLGFGAQDLFLNAFGVAQTVLGLLVVVGLWRRRTYPLLFLITLVTAFGVWQSIIDPWSWVMEGGNVLFYPSLIVLAAAIVLWGRIDQDSMALDARKAN